MKSVLVKRLCGGRRVKVAWKLFQIQIELVHFITMSCVLDRCNQQISTGRAQEKLYEKHLSDTSICSKGPNISVSPDTDFMMTCYTWANWWEHLEFLVGRDSNQRPWTCKPYELHFTHVSGCTGTLVLGSNFIFCHQRHQPNMPLEKKIERTAAKV